MTTRKLAIATGAGATYLASVYLTYQYFSPPPPTSCPCSPTTSCPDGSTSYVSSPTRTHTFEKIASTYDAQIQKDEFVMGINLLRRALLYFHSRGDILEVGAGTARNLPYYPRRSRVVLTDASEAMARRARDKIAALSRPERDRFGVVVADAGRLSEKFRRSSFDTVVDTFGLCSFDDPVAVLLEMERVCRPGGKIILLEHGRSKSWDKVSEYLDENAERHAKNWGCVWNRDLDAILEKSGLEVEVLWRWHFGTTYYVVCRPRKVGGE